MEVVVAAMEDTAVMNRLRLRMVVWALELQVVDGEIKAKGQHPTPDTLVIAKLGDTVLNKVVVHHQQHILQVGILMKVILFSSVILTCLFSFTGSSSAGYSAYGDQSYGGGSSTGYDNPGSYGGSAAYGGTTSEVAKIKKAFLNTLSLQVVVVAVAVVVAAMAATEVTEVAEGEDSGEIFFSGLS